LEQAFEVFGEISSCMIKDP
jgi:hypothetical protein